MKETVRKLSVYRVNHLPGEDQVRDPSEGVLQSTQEFDDSGNLLAEITYTAEGEIADKNVYRFDESGRLTESMIYGQDGDVLERVKAFRDFEGKLIKEEVCYLDGSVDTRHFEYDANGALTGLKVTDDEGSLEYVEKYEYQDGKLVKTERLLDGDELVFSQEDMYEDGLIRTRKTWSNEDEEPYTLVQEFNAAGRRLAEFRYDGKDQVIERNIYEEDEAGRLICIVEENRQRKNTTVFRYDEEGRMTYQAETDLKGQLNHEVFRTYDQGGRLALARIEAAHRATGLKTAYSLIYVYE